MNLTSPRVIGTLSSSLPRKRTSGRSVLLLSTSKDDTAPLVEDDPEPQMKKRQRCVSPEHNITTLEKFSSPQAAMLKDDGKDDIDSLTGVEDSWGDLSEDSMVDAKRAFALGYETDATELEEEEIDQVQELLEDYEIVSLSRRSKIRRRESVSSKRRDMSPRGVAETCDSPLLQEEKLKMAIFKIMVYLVQSESPLRGATSQERLAVIRSTKKLLQRAVSSELTISCLRFSMIEMLTFQNAFFPPREVELPSETVQVPRSANASGNLAPTLQDTERRGRAFLSYLATESKKLCRERRAILSKQNVSAMSSSEDDDFSEEEVIKSRTETIEAMHEIAYIWLHLLTLDGKHDTTPSSLQLEVAMGAFENQFRENADSFLFDLAYYLSVSEEDD